VIIPLKIKPLEMKNGEIILFIFLSCSAKGLNFLEEDLINIFGIECILSNQLIIEF